jgi:hypothetical protein
MMDTIKADVKNKALNRIMPTVGGSLNVPRIDSKK